jgi:nucleoside-diphosphate-sugar epimerase
MPGSLFVTGGTGFVGSRFLQTLDPGRYPRIVCLSRAKPASGPPNVEYIAGDLTRSATYAAALAGCETVVHLAAVTGKNRPETYFQVNREGTRALIGECKRAGTKRLLYVSTIAAKFTNQHRYYYAQSKRQAEEAVSRGGLSYTIVRPTMVLGKGSPVLEGLARLAKLPVMPVFGNGRALVQPVSVDDLAACLAAILEDPAFVGRTVEIGGPDILSIEELLIKIRGGAGPVMHLPAGPIAGVVGLLEKILLPVLPFTAGQIASFVNDGTIEPDVRVAEWQTRMQRIDRMLA